MANYRLYIYAGNEPVAVDDRNTDVQFHYYNVSDHQGSVAAFETGGDPASNYVNESFTAYGNRRSGEGWSGAPNSTDELDIGLVTRRGYTGETTLGGLDGAQSLEWSDRGFNHGALQFYWWPRYSRDPSGTARTVSFLG